MNESDKPEMLLGRNIPVVDEYAPQLLYPIPRAEGRSRLGPGDEVPFTGTDLWHAYEMSWLDESGKPVVKVGRFNIPADSPNMVESKSFKLYLNSLNNRRFSSIVEVRNTIVHDISQVVGTAVTLELSEPDDSSLAGSTLPGYCLDELSVTVPDTGPDATLLVSASMELVEETLYSHLLRSLCPVTGQPDWATLWIHYRGHALDHSALLRYILAYRQHQGFHEQCVEQMFMDILQRSTAQLLTIQAFYTRRGGLDINPLRSTDPSASPLPRLNRQ